MDGKHYILIVDYYCRFPELRPLSNLRANDVIEACQEIFPCHGIPKLFVSDNGPQYANISLGNSHLSTDSNMRHLHHSIPKVTGWPSALFRLSRVCYKTLSTLQ